MKKWPRFVAAGILACAAVTALALRDLAKTLARTVELPEDHDG